MGAPVAWIAVTADDADDAAEVPPTLFDAVTVNVYEVPAVRPVIVVEVAGADTVLVAPPGDAVTVYEVSVPCPVNDGAVHVTPTLRAPAPAGACWRGSACSIAWSVERARPSTTAATTPTIASSSSPPMSMVLQPRGPPRRGRAGLAPCVARRWATRSRAVRGWRGGGEDVKPGSWAMLE